MAEFEVGGHQYISDKLDARTQFHIARRLIPVLTSFKDLISSDSKEDLGENLAALAPFMEAVAKMPDSDVDYVLNAALAVTRRGMKGPSGELIGWTPIWSGAAKRVMFDDIDMMVMLQIARTVITESLSGFFSDNPLSSTG